MSLILLDRVKQTTTTIGTGTISLNGLTVGFQPFSSLGDGATTYYTIQGDADWEVGIGIYSSNTLTRDTVLSSSNGGALVNFTKGTKNVFVTLPAEKTITSIASANASVTVTQVGTEVNLAVSGGGTVTSVAATAGTGISITGSPITTSGTLNITNTAPDQTVALTQGGTTTITGTYPNFTISSADQFQGTVTSVTGTSPVASSGGTTPVISMPAATTSVSGYLTSTDWTTFNNKGSGTVTSVAALTLGTTGTDLSSTVATGTTTPVITLQVPTASAANRGALSSADWTTFNNKGSGTVTSVGGTGTVNGITLTGTVTSSGNLTLGGTLANVDLATQVTGNLPVTNLNSGTSASATTFWRGDGSWATPGTVTSVAQSFTGGLISVAGSPITSSGTLALTVAGTSGGIPYFSSGTTWATSAALAANALVIGGGAAVAPATTTTGTGVVTALGVNTGTAGAFVVNGGVLGTPSSGTVTNLTGTASININGTVGATTPNIGSFTTVNLSAGTTTVAPLDFATGTNLTTPAAGSWEYDGTAFYATPIASNRAVAVIEHFVARTGTKTMTSNTSLQSIFDNTTGTGGLTSGALTVGASTSYFFEMSINVSAMSATSGNFGFSILGAGTATFTSAAWHAFGLDQTNQQNGANTGTTWQSTAGATGNIIAAATGTAASAIVKGIFRINGAGTIIPSIQLTTANAAIIGVNTWFKCYPVGTNTVISVGNWA